MDFLNWYDWIQPTTPDASLFFGILLAFIVTGIVWVSSKEIKTSGTVFTIGVVVSFARVFLLNVIGFYG